jgi:hypothetical protein
LVGVAVFDAVSGRVSWSTLPRSEPTVTNTFALPTLSAASRATPITRNEAPGVVSAGTVRVNDIVT